jgi:hypothetical protein
MSEENMGLSAERPSNIDHEIPFNLNAVRCQDPWTPCMVRRPERRAHLVEVMLSVSFSVRECWVPARRLTGLMR